MIVKNIISVKELAEYLEIHAKQREYVNECHNLGFNMQEWSANKLIVLLQRIFSEDLVRRWATHTTPSMYISENMRISSHEEMAGLLMERYGEREIKPLSKEEFVSYINAVKESISYSDECKKLGLMIGDHLDCVGALISLVSKLMEETA